MRVTDPDWIRAFGHDSSAIEPPPKLGKIKATRAQLESKMVIETARLFSDAKKSAKRDTLFE